MTILTVPSPVDALAKIAQHMAALPFGSMTEARRAKIVRNCLGPVVLLIEAVELAAAAGPDEEAVLMQFIRALYAQSEAAKREKYFSELMEKLLAHRDKL
jgi:3-hydroxyisobutyrate dehydrogenase-like beta-hydroxyacid dehydrogenase